MDESSIYKRATNPEQYDLDSLSWESEAGAESPSNIFFWEYLKKYAPKWNGKNVLDIGAGDGWLLNEARKAGAKSVLGIEPSERNRKLVANINPNVEVLPDTLEDYEVSNKRFDVVFSIMSLPHIKNLEMAYKKMGLLLEPGGELITVVPDYNYFKSPRHDYKVQAETINPDEYAISITRPSGTLSDIVRKDELYKKAAEKAGLIFLEQVPMLPTEAYVSKAPKYKPFMNTALNQLFRFCKP